MKEKNLKYLSFSDRKIFIVRLITFFSIFLMLIGLFLPYVSATTEHKEFLNFVGNTVIDNMTGFTGKELINLNLFELIKLHANDTSYDGSGLIVGLIAAIIVLTILSAMLLILKKDVLSLISTALNLLLIFLINFDFTDRGFVGYKYDWGVSHFFFLFFATIIIVSIVALLIYKKIKKQGD